MFAPMTATPPVHFQSIEWLRRYWSSLPLVMALPKQQPARFKSKYPTAIEKHLEQQLALLNTQSGKFAGHSTFISWIEAR